MAQNWKIVVEPMGRNPGAVAAPAKTDDKKKGAVARAKEKVSGTASGPEQGVNEGGMIIYVSNGSTRQEVSRVAFVRRNSNNPKVAFDKQLQAEVEKARAAVTMLNEQFVGSGELQ